jgi:tape measure domain-containing protein
VADEIVLRFRLTAEDADALRGLNRVSDQADHTSGKLGGIGKAGIAVGTMIGGMATAGISALGGLAASAVSTGLSTASAMQQANIGFSTLLGSTQKAKAFVGDLSKFAANTPFEFPGLVDSSRTLLGVGVAAKDVIPMLTDFGDAAGALAIDQDHFKGIMMATSQALAAGKFQAGDLNQIMNNGLPVWSILAKGMHKTVPELRDMTQAGQLLAKDVMPALLSQMHKDYGGAMQQQSQTLSGLWSTMQDTMAQGMAQVLTPLVPLLQKALPVAMDYLGKGLSALTGWVSTVVGWFTKSSDAAKSAQNALGFLGDIVRAVGGWWNNELMPALRSAANNVMPSIKEAIASVSKTMSEHQDIINYVKAAFTILGKYLTEILIPYLGEVVKTLAKVVGPAFEAIAWTISTIVIPAVRKILEVFLDVVGSMLNGAVKMFGWVPGVGDKLKDAASQFHKFRDDVNGALAGINDKHVNVTVETRYTGGGAPIQTIYGGGHPMAAGGIVTGPTHILAGEAGPEAIIPLSQSGLMGTVNVYLSGFMGNEDAIVRQVTDSVRRATGRGYGYGT